MGLTKPIEQYLFSNLLIRIHVFMYLKDIIRGDYTMKTVVLLYDSSCIYEIVILNYFLKKIAYGG